MGDFVPARLSQARKLKRWNMSQLGDAAGVTRQAISQFEKNKAAPSGATLRQLGRVLGVPEKHFQRPLTELEKRKESPANFRSMSAATARGRDQAESLIELMALLHSEFTHLIEMPPPNLPSFDLTDFRNITDDEIDDFASSARRHFGIGDGPISNLILLLENHGVLIATHKLDPKLEALSQWYDGMPFVLLDDTKSCCRQRYSLAHELGHLLLHRDLIEEDDLRDRETYRLIEHQADRFSASFLLPESSFAAEVYRTDWESLIAIKEHWLVSIAAIVMRLHSIELITESRKNRLFQTISAKGARRVEPLDRAIPNEVPRLYKKVVALLTENSLLELNGWPDRIGLPPEIVSRLLGLELASMVKPAGAPLRLIFNSPERDS